MYENEIYSGSDAGTHTTGQFSGAQGNSYQYNSYQTQDNTTAGNAHDNEKKENLHKTGFFRKAILSISLGLFFGIFAGIGFYAVQQGLGMMQETPAVSGDAIDSQVSASIEETQTGMNLNSTNHITYVQNDVSDVVEEVMPAMVSIINNYTETSDFFGRTYSEEYAASGSGIIVAENDSELLMVTNHHVVSDANSLEVTFIDGSKAEARIKGTDSEMDLAVIAVSLGDLSEETKEAIAIATLGDSDNLKLGEPVIAIGNALGYGQSVTNGIVSALDREIKLEDGSAGVFIQTNAAINPGNSGGALLNIEGEVIGINSNKFGGEAVEGMGYAIPITSASPIIADLMERQTRNKVAAEDMGYIGIELQEVTSQISQMYNMPEGIYVISAQEGGAAWTAGIMKGDIITKFDGERVTSYSELQNVLQYYAAGESAKITVMRPENGEYVSYEFEIVLGSKPATNK